MSKVIKSVHIDNDSLHPVVRGTEFSYIPYSGLFQLTKIPYCKFFLSEW